MLLAVNVISFFSVLTQERNFVASNNFASKEKHPGAGFDWIEFQSSIELNFLLVEMNFVWLFDETFLPRVSVVWRKIFQQAPENIRTKQQEDKKNAKQNPAAPL